LSKVGPPAHESAGAGYQPRYDVVLVDGRLVSHAGVGLLAELADRVGLTAALDRFAAPSGRRARRHQPARVLRNLIVMLADGGTASATCGCWPGAGSCWDRWPRSRPRGGCSSGSPKPAPVVLARDDPGTSLAPRCWLPGSFRA
jgi:hypothetical protein